MTYLLDAMIVSYFRQAGHEDALAAAAKRCSMALVDEVRRELEADRSRGGRPFMRWLDTSNIGVRSIAVGSPASATLAQLLNPALPDKGRGERASIALAAHDVSLTFVTNDKNGMWIALRELWMPGERILGLAVFLRRLFEQAALMDPGVVDDVISIAIEAAQRPTWWASWRAGLKPGSSSSALSLAPLLSAVPQTGE
ncbi:MAG: hypothetical protein JXB05_26335 [Myxococcaceae bacterium]|nr:hypothetical protein [Myxococcaceae bacterium]